MFNEPILDPLLRRFRARKVIPLIKSKPQSLLLDIGCGYNFSFLKTVKPYVKSGIGIDFKVTEIHEKNIQTIRAKINETLPFQDNQFDFVTMLAVLEHLETPEAVCKEIIRILKPEGQLIITVPSCGAKPILELLAVLKIVLKAEIDDHKKYYNKEDIEKIFHRIDNARINSHKYFQFGMNNFCIVTKNP